MARLAVFINVISLTPRPLRQTQSTDETFESVRLKSNASIKVSPFTYNRKFKSHPSWLKKIQRVNQEKFKP